MAGKSNFYAIRYRAHNGLERVYSLSSDGAPARLDWVEVHDHVGRILEAKDRKRVRLAYVHVVRYNKQPGDVPVVNLSHKAWSAAGLTAAQVEWVLDLYKSYAHNSEKCEQLRLFLASAR